MKLKEILLYYQNWFWLTILEETQTYLSISLKTNITELLSYEEEIKELSGKKCRENSEMSQAFKK